MSASATGSTEPIEPIEPTESTESTEPIEPTESTESTEPVEPTESPGTTELLSSTGHAEGEPQTGHSVGVWTLSPGPPGERQSNSAVGMVPSVHTIRPSRSTSRPS